MISKRIAIAAGVALAVCLGGAATSRAAGSQTRLPGAHKVTEPSPCAGYKTYDVPMVDRLQPNKTYTAVVSTNRGDFIITLLPKVAPIAVQSFIFLVQHHYFDGVVFHRVLPGFMIQGGDPTGTGYCGPGYEFKNEPVHQAYTRGVVAMANAGANTNGSQFFVMLAANGLPPNYTIFGVVHRGMSAVDRIAAVPRGPNADNTEVSVPKQKVYMKRVRIVVS